MINAVKLKDKAVDVAAAGGTEVEHILGAAQEDAGFEKLLKFRKGDFFIGEELVPLGTKYIAHADRMDQVLDQVRRRRSGGAQDLSRRAPANTP